MSLHPPSIHDMKANFSRKLNASREQARKEGEDDGRDLAGDDDDEDDL